MSQLTVGQRVNVSRIKMAEWQSVHQLFNAVVIDVQNRDTPLERVKVQADAKSWHSGAGSFNPIALGGLFYLAAYNIEPVK